MADTEADVHVELETEAERVERWRYEEFRRMRFDEHDSELLRDSAADLHYVAELIGAGCPTHLARAIVL